MAKTAGERCKTWRQRHPDKVRSYSRAKGREILQRYRSTHPEKAKAHSILGDAVRYGRLTKLPCEKCGSVKSQGHHDDYSKPLEVRWLCDQHHREVHK